MPSGSKMRLRALLKVLQWRSMLIMWGILISTVFWTSYCKYKTEAKYFYLRQMLGCGLYLSRATASVVNVCCFMVIIPMCRSLTTFIRRIGSKISVRFICDWVDSSIKFHTICALTMLLSSCFHSIAHIFNMHNSSVHYNFKYEDINIARFKGEDPLTLVLTSVSGVTGILMIVILLVLSSSSVKYIRNVNYDLFWLNHHLFIVFFIILIFHPMSGLLKEQVNTFSHSPGCQMNVSIHKKEAMSSKEKFHICEETPVFVSESSVAWKWVVSAFLLYLSDLGFRLIRRRDPVSLLSFQAYSCHLMCLKFFKKGFVAKPGQYIYLQFPKVSSVEWHPFSISECPTIQDPSFTIHLQTKGDWSNLLKKNLICLLHEDNELEFPVSLSCDLKITRFFVDGPYGSCFEDILNHSVSICIAGGVGFTPFASFLRCLRTDIKAIQKLGRLHLLWICRDVRIFYCFSNLLQEIFHLVWNSSHPDKIEIELYLTQPYSWEDITVALKDTFVFLKPRIQFGRPDWDLLFQNWSVIYKKADVGLFCCGPQSLNAEVKQRVQEKNLRSCSFSYHHETFS